MKNSTNYNKQQLFYENAVHTMVIIIAVLSLLCVGALTMLIFTNCSANEEETNTETNQPMPSSTPAESTAESTTSHETYIVVTHVPETDAPTTIPNTEAPEVTTTPETKDPEPTIDEIYLPATHKYSMWYSDYDFESEQLHYLYDLCQQYDIDIRFVLAEIATESGFRSQAKNKYSSATGYGQVVKGTAEWVYENLLKRGDYDTSRHEELMKDWRLNMDIMMRLIKWLNDRYGTYQKTAMYYHGSTSYDSNVDYANRVSSKLTELFGITMADIER